MSFFRRRPPSEKHYRGMVFFLQIFQQFLQQIVPRVLRHGVVTESAAGTRCACPGFRCHAVSRADA